ncbi:unnamed protein product [Orchesella dallaii]|uniref:Metalloendopeptidase n=1 Tax=Orchesella dallaii TaxID=48710 RepID=A0ABP1RQT0_9HEXA
MLNVKIKNEKASRKCEVCHEWCSSNLEWFHHFFQVNRLEKGEPQEGKGSCYLSASLARYLISFDTKARSLLTLVHFWAWENDITLSEKGILRKNQGSNIPDPAALEWLCLFYLTEEGIITSLKEMRKDARENERNSVLIEGTKNSTISFPRDAQFRREWQQAKIKYYTTKIDNEYVVDVLELTLGFFHFCSKNDFKGKVLKTKEGKMVELLPAIEDGLISESINPDLFGDPEELRRQGKKLEDELKGEMYLMQPFVPTRRFKVDQQKFENHVVPIMKKTAKKLEFYLGNEQWNRKDHEQIMKSCSQGPPKFPLPSSGTIEFWMQIEPHAAINETFLSENQPVPPTPPVKVSEGMSPFENKTRATCSTREDLMSVRNAIKDPNHRWAKFFVYPDKDFNKHELQVINDAMYNLMKVLPCVSFGIWPPHSTPSGDYVYIIKGTNNGCDSHIGKQGGRQDMNLQSPGCMHIGTVMHEMIHALGFFHEQARPDRDDHVSIYYDNIIPGQRHNFHKFGASEVSTLGIPYNVRSIMHYESDAWSNNGKPTILAKDGKSDNSENRKASENTMSSPTKHQFVAEKSPAVANGNPMLNDAVLQHFFKLIPFNLSEFKNFRFVCQLWKELSTPRFRQNAQIKLSNNEPLLLDIEEIGNAYRYPYKSLDFEKIEKRSKFMEQKPFFQKYVIEERTELSDSLLDNGFWLRFAPTMTHLELVNSILNTNDVRQVIFEMTPNLKSLSLKGNYFEISSESPENSTEIVNSVWEWEEGFSPPASRINKNLRELTIDHREILGEFPIRWKEFIFYFPNIKILSLQLKNASTPYNWFKKFLQTVISARQNCGHHHFAQVESLDILNTCTYPPFHLPLDVLALLRQVAFPLRNLVVHMDWPDSPEEVHKDLLKIYSRTLTSLTVCRVDPNVPLKETFTQDLNLTLLTELTLIGAVWGNLHFLGKIPQLKKLVIMSPWAVKQMGFMWTVKKWCEIYAQEPELSGVRVIGETNFSGEEMRGVVLPNLETFIFGTEVCNGSQVQELSKLMPNLKTLQLGMGNCGFQMLCKEWDRLEHLTIDPADVNEEGFLGTQNNMIYCDPNLIDLKCLKTFRVGPISSNLGGMRVNLTNDTITCGVLALQTLEDAVFGVMPEASDNLKASLAYRFPGMRSLGEFQI